MGTQERERGFVDADLSGARFVRCYLDQASFRGAVLSWASIDGEIDGLTINGIDIAPFVEAELNKRFPGRELRHATSRADLQVSWENVQAAWREAVTRFDSLPKAMLEERVDGEWSFVETLRHLVMVTDVWLRGSIQRVESPFHPIGQPFSGYAEEGYDTSYFTENNPTLDRILEIRAQRQAMVTEFLTGDLDDDDLMEERPNPWAPDRTVTVGRCINIILNEEWEHLRFALRDADILANREHQ